MSGVEAEAGAKTGYVESPFGIRTFEPADVDSLFQAVRESLKEVFVWLPWFHPEYSRDECSAWVDSRSEAWKSGQQYSFAIYDRRDGGLVGGVELNQINRTHRIANVTYWVRTSWAGRGAATAATRLAAEFGFRELGLQRVEILAAVGNDASARVAEKAGATKEGLLRNRFLNHGKPADAVLYSLVPEDLA